MNSIAPTAVAFTAAQMLAIKQHEIESQLNALLRQAKRTVADDPARGAIKGLNRRLRDVKAKIAGLKKVR
jgi:hypothetical protein